MTPVEAIKQATSLVKPIVDRIEGQPETTKGRYGDYLSVLVAVPKNDQRRMAALLILAGANKGGVKAALKIVSE